MRYRNVKYNYKIISHFYISYSSVNEISDCKNIANCTQKTPFELQLEDGLIKKPKHFADLTFNYVLYKKTENLYTFY